MCPKAHSPTTFRFQETLRTPHRGGLIHSQDATRNAGRWDTARTGLRENVCVLVPRNGGRQSAGPERGSVSQSGPRCQRIRNTGRKHLPCLRPCPLGAPVWEAGWWLRPLYHSLGQAQEQRWARLEPRAGWSGSGGGLPGTLWEVDAGRATQSRGLCARPRVHGSTLLRARPWPSQERDPAHCPACSPCKTLGVLMVTQRAGRGGYSGRRAQEPGQLGAQRSSVGLGAFPAAARRRQEPRCSDCLSSFGVHSPLLRGTTWDPTDHLGVPPLLPSLVRAPRG